MKDTKKTSTRADPPLSPARAQALLEAIDRLALFGEILAGPVGQAYCAMLRCLAAEEPEAGFLTAVARLSGLLSAHAERHGSPPSGDVWQDYLLSRLLEAQNTFSRTAARDGARGLSPALTALARQDLVILQELFQANCAALRAYAATQDIHAALPYLMWGGFEPDCPVENNHPQPEVCRALSALADWREAVPLLAAHYRRSGAGDFARFHAFRWVRTTQGGRLQGIAHPDPIRLEELIGDERQRRLLAQNTEHLLAGYRANNVLLCGDRGTGKSSSIKALLHRYGHQGLRLVEVAKEHLGDFPDILAELEEQPQAFIIFVDDLSFEPHETDYKALKAILEGSLAAQPRNVVIYATSNRSHLIRENFSDRTGILEGEIHPKETLQETFSLSDRFGIRISFVAPTQGQYLAIVTALATQRGLEVEPPALRARALTWAQQQNGFSGRTARQFVDYLEGDLGTTALQ